MLRARRAISRRVAARPRCVDRRAGWFSLAIFLCFLGSLLWGVEAGAWLLPLSGLFMSIMYPTLNSKGISCFPKSQHGAAAGVILFFTAAAAALGPLAMAAVSDAYGSTRAGFVLATGFALLLFAGLLGNWLLDPAQRRRLARASDRGQATMATFRTLPDEESSPTHRLRRPARRHVARPA